MRLIDLLVQELPSRGGWPEGVHSITQDDDGSLFLWEIPGAYPKKNSWRHPSGCGLLSYWCGERAFKSADDRISAYISAEQYAAALAASELAAWLPGDLPPEGIECEVKSGKDSWTLCKIVHSSSAGVAFIYLGEPDGISSYLGVLDCISAKAAGQQFRPMRTEADRKREEIAQQMCNLFGNGIEIDEKEGYGKVWLDVYDAIAAGEVSGIKLDLNNEA